MILPRTPSPVPLEERDVDELNPEEMRELLRRQKVCTESLFRTLCQRYQEHNLTHRTSKENNVKMRDAPIKVKRERPQSMQLPSRSYKVARTDNRIEEVNLADSDDEGNTDAPGKAPTAEPSTRKLLSNMTNNNGIVDLEDFEPED